MYGNAVKQSIRVDCSLRGRHLFGLTPPTTGYMCLGRAPQGGRAALRLRRG